MSATAFQNLRIRNNLQVEWPVGVTHRVVDLPTLRKAREEALEEVMTSPNKIAAFRFYKALLFDELEPRREMFNDPERADAISKSEQ